MNPGETETLALAAGAAFVQLVGLASSKVSKIRRRTDRIKIATEALQAHYTQLEEFLNDPAAPSELCDMLLWASDKVADAQAARELVQLFISTRNQPPKAASNSPVDQALSELRRHRADLVDQFDNCLRLALAAMFLRWDDTARIFEASVATLPSDRRIEVELSARALSEKFGRGPMGGNHTGNMAHA